MNEIGGNEISSSIGGSFVSSLFGGSFSTSTKNTATAAIKAELRVARDVSGRRRVASGDSSLASPIVAALWVSNLAYASQNEAGTFHVCFVATMRDLERVETIRTKRREGSQAQTEVFDEKLAT